MEVFLARDLYGLSRDVWQHLTGTFTYGSGKTKAELVLAQFGAGRRRGLPEGGLSRPPRGGLESPPSARVPNWASTAELDEIIRQSLALWPV